MFDTMTKPYRTNHRGEYAGPRAGDVTIRPATIDDVIRHMSPRPSKWYADGVASARRREEAATDRRVALMMTEMVARRSEVAR